MQKWLIAGIVILLAYGGWRAFHHDPEEATVAAPTALKHPTKSSPVAPPSVSVTETPTSVAQKPRQVIQTAAVRSQDQDRAADETIRNLLWPLVRDAKPALNMSDAEFNSFARIVVDMYKVNGALKTEAAQVAKLDSGAIEVTIPARPDVAVEMRRMLNEQLSAALTPDRATEVMASVGGQLIREFQGFGAANEKYTFTPHPGEPGVIDYSFESRIPEGAASTDPDLKPIQSEFGMLGSSANNTTLDAVLSYPQYRFLRQLVRSKM